MHSKVKYCYSHSSENVNSGIMYCRIICMLYVLFRGHIRHFGEGVMNWCTWVQMLSKSLKNNLLKWDTLVCTSHRHTVQSWPDFKQTDLAVYEVYKLLHADR